jgi:hypothetical protein
MSTMILDLLTRGVVLTADGDSLRYDGPDGAMTVEDLEGLRANKEAILEMLRPSPSPYPWPAILGPGPWREIPEPDDVEHYEDLTGWRRWYEGPNGELRSVT